MPIAPTSLDQKHVEQDPSSVPTQFEGKRKHGMDGPPSKMPRLGAAESAGSSMQASAPTPGSAAIPTKTHDQDGSVDMKPNTTLREVNTKIFTYAGTFWMQNVTGAGVTNANVWSKFPWEQPNFWLNEPDCYALFQEYMYWKPKSVHVTFGNVQSYTSISTGTTPFMMPNINGKFVLVVDKDYISDIDSDLFNSGLVNVQGGSVTVASLNTLRNSFQSEGYAPNSSGGDTVQQFIPGIDITDSTISNLQQWYGFLNKNAPNSKGIRTGQGHEITETWHFHNRYWRSTTELLTESIHSSGTTNLSVRADEYFGVVQINPAATQVPYQVGAFGTVPGPWVGFSVPAGWSGLLWQDSQPQPPIWIHFIPDVGVLGSTGLCNVMVDFKITWEMEFTGRQPCQLRSIPGQITSSTTNLFTPNRITYPPIFLPIAITPGEG